MHFPSSARVLLDTGTSDCYVDSEVANSLECKGQSSSIALASTASSAKVRGVANCNISACKGSYSLELGVVDNLRAGVILGLGLKMHRSTTFVTGGPRRPIRVGDQKVCRVAAANVKPRRIFQFLNPKVRPISIPSRRFNAEDSRFIAEEINKLLDHGIIKHSECPWRAQVLVTKDERHKRRMVIDYSQTINRFTELDAYPLPKIDHQVHELAKCKLFSTLDLKSAYIINYL